MEGALPSSEAIAHQHIPYTPLHYLYGRMCAALFSDMVSSGGGVAEHVVRHVHEALRQAVVSRSSLPCGHHQLPVHLQQHLTSGAFSGSIDTPCQGIKCQSYSLPIGSTQYNAKDAKVFLQHNHSEQLNRPPRWAFIDLNPAAIHVLERRMVSELQGLWSRWKNL